MNIEWEKYKDFLIKKLPDYAARLAAPVALYQIEALEEELNVKLPRDFVELYLINNGEEKSHNESNKWGIICGSKMLSVEEIANYFLWEESIPKGREKQIPIFKDIEDSYYIAIDLSSKSGKNYGQIISFGLYNDKNNLIIAPSLSAFFKKINDFIESGYLYYPVKLEKNREVSVHDVRKYFEHTTSDLVSILMGEVF